jgi:SOS-response transcriptional repressor LexA
MATKNIRPTMKQYHLMSYIAEFAQIHGYGPSYREIMMGCGYSSVATVAEHVNNLIARGHLRKRDRSARSLEVISMPEPEKIITKEVSESEEKWLVEKVELFFTELEAADTIESNKIDELYVLVGALKVLGMDGPAYMFIRRLTELKDKYESRKNKR